MPENPNSMTDIMSIYAVKERPSLEEAKEKLRADAYLRTVGEVLARYCKVQESELQEKVTALLYESSVDGANRDSIARKVRTWLNKQEKKTSIDRESALQLAFALGLELKDAEEMLRRLCDESFHWRNPDDIVLLFALERKMSYRDACALLKRMRPLYKPAVPDIGNIRQRISLIQDEEALMDFLANDAAKLGIKFSPQDTPPRKGDNVSVRETLAQYCGVEESELQKKVTDILCRSSGDEANRDSIRNKVRGWLNNKTPADKESAVQLAFALKLKPADAEQMLCSLCGEGFDLGNSEDIVWRFALERRMTYLEACALRSRMPLFPMTENVKQRAGQVQTEEELRNFLIAEAPKLGTMHNTAYDLFMRFMNLLSDGGDLTVAGVEKNANGERISNNILRHYFYRDVVPVHRNRRRILEDAIQRDIKKNWADEGRLSRMKNRRIDVTRKVLILLFLASDGGEVYGNLDGETDEDIFEDTYARLTTMLLNCGFPPLDSRKPFDWMVLYCLAKSEDIIDIDENIRDFLSEIFASSD